MSEMNYNELKKFISSKKEANLYFLSGETQLINYFEKSIISKTLGNNYTDFDCVFLQGESFSNKNLSNAIETFPISTSKKCVVLKDLPYETLNENEINNFLELISDLPDFCILIISQISYELSSKNLLKVKKIEKFVKKNGILGFLRKEDFPLEKQLIVWAKRDYNKTLDSKTAKKILVLCKDYQIHELQSEFQKICELEKSNIITEDSLNFIWKPKNKVSVFELSKAIISKNEVKCFKILSQLFDNNEQATYILNIISSEFKDLYRVKLFKENNENISKLLEIFDYKRKEFRIKNAARICQNISFSNLKEIISELIDADLKLKLTQIDSKTVLTQLIAKIFKKLKN